MSTLYSVGQMNQLGDALEAAGFSADDVTKLRSSPELLVKTKAELLGHTEKGVKAKKSILTPVTTLTCPAVLKFVAAEFFQGEGFYLSENFRTNFLGKTEENVPEMALRVGKLTRAALDKEIMDDLGPDKQETSLAHLAHLLKMQSKGEKGILLTNGYANIAYIRDVNGGLWAVDADWYSGYRYWGVGAYPVEDPRRWCALDQVLSRD